MSSALAATAAASAAAPPLLNTGRLSLRSLGVPQLVITHPSRSVVQSQALRYRLPAGARQGAGRWYVMRLHFLLKLASTSGPGLIDISGETNGRSSDLDEVAVSRRRGVLQLAWNQVGLIDGRREGTTHGARLELTDRNVMVNAGVQPGLNTLRFQVEQYGKARLAQLTIFGDSGIIASRLSPGVLVLHVSAHPGPTIAVGQTLTVTARIDNRGQRPVRRVSLSLDYPATQFRLLSGKASEQVAEIGHRPYLQTYRLKAIAPGSTRARPISLAVDSVNANPGATLTPTVVARRSTNITLWLTIALAGFGGLLIAVGRTWRHQGRRSRVV